VSRRPLSGLALTLLASLLAGHHGRSFADVAPQAWRDTQQLVMVVTPDWNANHGVLSTFERTNGEWKAVHESTPVTIGRSGSAWGIGLHPAATDGPIKQEGDGRSPAGVFRIGDAFGYAASLPTSLHYSGMLESSYCVDVSGSPLYNRIVDAKVVGAAGVAGSTEPMRRDIHAGGDQRYKLGFVVEHNPAAVSQAGSCIFAHLWRTAGESTAGCTAMNERAMRDLLGWLRDDRRPIFVLLPQAEYTRLREDWHLPKRGTEER
jgi:L,D-peptidoglycan transpeptidase YkuD (ErfK/YbiS/YcfS/YnhG family)